MKGLEGLKVVELTSYVAGPACPRILAEMGATVYKIEPFEGDDYRNNASGFGMSKTEIDDPAFDLTSTNKTFVSINLKTEGGAEFLDKLLKEADVLVTSFRDGGLKRLGLDYETASKKYPRLFGHRCAAMAGAVLKRILADSTIPPTTVAAVSSPRCLSRIISLQ